MKTVAIDDFKNYRFLSGLSYSPDGKTAVFAVKKAQKDGKGYTSDLYMYRDGELRRLTAGGKEGSFAWKNSNELFVFASREEEDKKRAEGREAFTPLYTLRLDGGEAEKTSELPFRASRMELAGASGRSCCVRTQTEAYEDIKKRLPTGSRFP